MNRYQFLILAFGLTVLASVLIYSEPQYLVHLIGGTVLFTGWGMLCLNSK